MKNATDITVILDRSGSMASIKTDTIGGFNTFVEDQKKISEECSLTLVQFDSQNSQEVVFDHVSIAEVKPLTSETFVPRGNTPLYDAVGQAIVRTGERLHKLSESGRPGKVIFVIITDGMENASKEYSREKVFDLIKRQTDVYKWAFVYLGANQDAMGVGAQIGIPGTMSMSYTAAPRQVGAVYASLSVNVAKTRMSAGPAAASMAWDEKQRKQAAEKK